MKKIRVLLAGESGHLFNPSQRSIALAGMYDNDSDIWKPF